MEYLPLGIIAVWVPEFAMVDLPFGRTPMMIFYGCDQQELLKLGYFNFPGISVCVLKLLLMFQPSYCVFLQR